MSTDLLKRARFCRRFRHTYLYILSRVKNGTALETEFRVKCSNWEGGEAPLTYIIHYHSSVKVLWYEGLESVSPRSQLPEGKESNDYNITITVEIRGRYGGHVITNLSVQVSIIWQLFTKHSIFVKRQPITPQTWCKLWILPAWCKYNIKLHQANWLHQVTSSSFEKNIPCLHQ